MKSSSRASFALTLGVAAMALLSGCGSSDGEAAGSGDTLQYVPTTSYALKAPATTTTTTTLAPGATPPAGGTVPTEQTYTIRAGDSLSRIAGLYDVTMDQIVAYNGWEDGINHFLLPGEAILIPPGAAVAGSTQTETATDAGSGDTGSTDTGSTDTGDAGDTGDTEEETATGEGCTYTIEAGDYPGTVASDFGITVDQLQAANPSRDFSVWFLATATINIPPEGDC